MANFIVTKDFVQDLFESEDPFPVDFDEAWRWLGYARKDSALRKLKKHFLLDQDFSFHQPVEAQTQGNREVSVKIDKYSLTADCFKEMGMLAETPQGRLVRQYYLECERFAKRAVREQLDRLKELEEDERIREEIRASLSSNPATAVAILRAFAGSAQKDLDAQIAE